MKTVSPETQSTQLADELHATFIVLASLSLLLITPFTVYNILQGELLLGLSALAVVLIFSFNAWSIYRHKRNHPALMMYGLIPVALFFLMLSVRNQGVIGAFWCYPAVISSFIILPERKAWIANLALFVTIFPTVWYFIDHHLAARIIVTLLIVSAYSAIFVHVIYKQQRKLRSLATIDSLTGVLNRTLLEETLDYAIHQNSRSGIPMTVVTIDLDDFKQINDKLGHDAGDQVLQQVGQLLQKRCRKVDRIFRIGGEEFLVFLFDTGNEDGIRVGKELCKIIAEENILPGQTITASAGVATLQANETSSKWTKRSDAKLYAAKLAGRNRVIA